MKLVQVNTVLNSGSTGRIAEQIGAVAMSRGFESAIVYGRERGQRSASATYRVGRDHDILAHGALSLLGDAQGLGSKRATEKLARWLEAERPDVVGLHNLHGYYLHYPRLFAYLKRVQIPVVWTLHDCWPLTGHCAHFQRVGCERWMTECHTCPMTRHYPRSLVDRSRSNFRRKRDSFRGVRNLTVVTPCRWLAGVVGRSFLQDYQVEVIHNGVDVDVFSPGPPAATSGEGDDFKIALGVASVWNEAKGLTDIAQLRQQLPRDWRIVLLGVSAEQRQRLPDGVEGVERTEHLDELVRWYRRARVFINPTWSDTFPSTNLEALACGTPVVTYDVGGSAEAIDHETGRKVDRGDVTGMADAVLSLGEIAPAVIAQACRSRAVAHFNQRERFGDVVDLYASRLHHDRRHCA